jgi:predicted nucleic acid binding AN1-type Zn finger protein
MCINNTWNLKRIKFPDRCSIDLQANPYVEKQKYEDILPPGAGCIKKVIKVNYD